MKYSYAKSKFDSDLNRTIHMESRMNQRGVSKDLVGLTLALGVPQYNGRIELSTRLIERYIQDLDSCLGTVCNHHLKTKLKINTVLPVFGSELKIPQFIMDRVEIEWWVPDSARMLYLDIERQKLLVKLLMEWRSSLIKARDKKGIVVVVQEGALLTTYANPENLGWNQ